jgi:hypothetical protein
MSCHFNGNCYKKNAILRSMRLHRFRSLFVVTGVLLLTAALAPKAHADVLVYFNFEDSTLGAAFDPNSDNVPPGGDNSGGGILAPVMLETNLITTGSVAGTLLNRTALDSDTADPGLALGMSTTPADNTHWIQFHADTTSFSNMSLSFAINTAGNGFNTVAFSFSTDGGTVFSDPVSHFITSGHGFQIITFAVPVGANNQPDVIFRLTFNGGTSSGTDLETVIDNIRLDGTPEPATTASGALAVVGLCWYRRRWLTRFLLLRRSAGRTGRLHRTFG